MDIALDPRSLLRMLWRRKWYFLAPATLIGAGAVALILLLPPMYRSEATILIEQQDVPEDIVPSLVTDQVDRRLEVLKQRVLITGNLLEIAERYDLYPEERETLSRSALAGLMRRHIDTQTVVTEFNDPRTGRSGEATLAFEVGFTYRDPAKAREVTNELVSSFLSGNIESRRDVAEQTASFFTQERADLDAQIDAIEGELADFKTENRELLPEEATFKRQLLSNIDQELRTLESDLRTLRERQGFLTTQLALTEEFEPRDDDLGGTTPESQLELLRAELATAEARYNAGHPDVVRLSREVRSLERVVGSRSGSSAFAAQEAQLAAELGRLEERYTEEHPDVARVRRELAAVRRAMADSAGRPAGRNATLSRNPAYVQLSSQLNSVEAEIAAIEEQRADLREERTTLQEQLARAPRVEREYTRLVRRLDNAIADREALADKEATVKLSGSLETQSVGERLRLIEPPTTPAGPSSPNKKLILALGLVLALSGGGVSAFLAEMLDRTVRSTNELVRILGDSPLVSIPVLSSPAERRRLWALRGVAVVGVLAAMTGAAFYVHHTILPLDVLGYALQNEMMERLTTLFPGIGGR